MTRACHTQPKERNGVLALLSAGSLLVNVAVALMPARVDSPLRAGRAAPPEAD
jgi:hypothetical protein